MVTLRRKRSLLSRMAEHWQMYLLLLLPLAYLIIFCYWPMLGVQIAFRKYSVRLGMWASKWIGFENFEKLFNSFYFERIVTNTLRLSLYSLVVGFPLPIIFALMLNCIRRSRARRTVQTVVYIPHFISVIVMVGIIQQMFDVRIGLIVPLFKCLFGPAATAPNLMIVPQAFPHIYVWSGIWQGLGWGTIIYTAALTAIDPSLHEVAVIDGASRLKRILHIDIPAIAPTIAITLILRFSSIMSIGFDKTYLMQNDLNLATSEVIATYVYKVGLQSSSLDFSYSTAVGLFNALINLALLLVANFISRKTTKSSLW